MYLEEKRETIQQKLMYSFYTGGPEWTDAIVWAGYPKQSPFLSVTKEQFKDTYTE